MEKGNVLLIIVNSDMMRFKNTESVLRILEK